MSNSYEMDDEQIEALISTAYMLGQRHTHETVMEALRKRVDDLVAKNEIGSSEYKNMSLLIDAFDGSQANKGEQK